MFDLRLRCCCLARRAARSSSLAVTILCLFTLSRRSSSNLSASSFRVAILFVIYFNHRLLLWEPARVLICSRGLPVHRLMLHELQHLRGHRSHRIRILLNNLSPALRGGGSSSDRRRSFRVWVVCGTLVLLITGCGDGLGFCPVLSTRGATPALRGRLGRQGLLGFRWLLDWLGLLLNFRGAGIYWNFLDRHLIYNVFLFLFNILEYNRKTNGQSVGIHRPTVDVHYLKP